MCIEVDNIVINICNYYFKHENQENRKTCIAGSVKSSPTGIIPCQDEFGGSFNFEVMLDPNFQSYRQKWNVRMIIFIII